MVEVTGDTEQHRENSNMYYYDDPLLDVLEKISERMSSIDDKLEYMVNDHRENHCCQDVPSTT